MSFAGSTRAGAYLGGALSAATAGVLLAVGRFWLLVCLGFAATLLLKAVCAWLDSGHRHANTVMLETPTPPNLAEVPKQRHRVQNVNRGSVVKSLTLVATLLQLLVGAAAVIAAYNSLCGSGDRDN